MGMPQPDLSNPAPKTRLVAWLLILPAGILQGIPNACAGLAFAYLLQGNGVNFSLEVAIVLSVVFGLFAFYGPIARARKTIEKNLHQAKVQQQNTKRFPFWNYLKCAAGFTSWESLDVTNDHHNHAKALAFKKRMPLTQRLRLFFAGIVAVMMPVAYTFISFVSIFLLFFSIAKFAHVPIATSFGLALPIAIAAGVVAFAFYYFWHDMPGQVLKDLGADKILDPASLPNIEIIEPTVEPSWWQKIIAHCLAFLVATPRAVNNAMGIVSGMLTFASFFGSPFSSLGITLAAIFGLAAFYRPLANVRLKLKNAALSMMTGTSSFTRTIVTSVGLKIANKVYGEDPHAHAGHYIFARTVAFTIPVISTAINIATVCLFFGTLSALSGGTLAIPFATMMIIAGAMALSTFITEWIDTTPKVLADFGYGAKEKVAPLKVHTSHPFRATPQQAKDHAEYDNLEAYDDNSIAPTLPQEKALLTDFEDSDPPPAYTPTQHSSGWNAAPFVSDNKPKPEETTGTPPYSTLRCDR